MMQHKKLINLYYTESSELVWTGVTGISLCTADALATGYGQHRIAVIQPQTISVTILQIVILTKFIGGGAGTVHLYCPTIFATSIKFPITHCSSPLFMLILSRILRFSSSRAHGFVLYTAFFNPPQG